VLLHLISVFCVSNLILTYLSVGIHSPTIESIRLISFHFFSFKRGHEEWVVYFCVGVFRGSMWEVGVVSVIFFVSFFFRWGWG